MHDNGFVPPDLQAHLARSDEEGDILSPKNVFFSHFIRNAFIVSNARMAKNRKNWIIIIIFIIVSLKLFFNTIFLVNFV